MSGIAGIVDFAGRLVDPAEVRAMLGIMDYRGPDGRGEWSSETIALGQCMFHTTPESREARLPLASADGGYVLVMDGRVDNWEELRERVLAAGATLRSRADEELVLAAYGLWGEGCVRHIDGDFALAVWDTRRRRLFVARDRLGFKPFFYHLSGTRFYFASDIAALVGLGIAGEIDEDVIAQFMGDTFLCTKGTIWSGISRLLPRHRAMLTRGVMRIEPYWTPEEAPDIRYKTQDEYTAHYRDLLFDEVRRASRTLGPVGCEVSGGLDSSAVFSVADALEKQGALLGPGLQGYTLGFPVNQTTNDLPYARAVSTHLRRPIAEIPPERPALAWYEAFAQEHRTVPPRPNCTMQVSLISAAHRDGCRVILNGVGGDEWLKGTAYAASDLIRKGEFSLLSGYLAGVSNAFGMRVALREVLQFGLYPLVPLKLRRALRKSRGRDGIDETAFAVLSQPLKERLRRLQDMLDPGLQFRDMEFKAPHRYAVDWTYMVWAKEWMELLGSLQGVELRSPLASRRMVEFSCSVPQAYRRWSGQDRWLHRRACEGIVAPEVLARRGKAEFSDVFLQHAAELSSRADWQEYVIDEGWATAAGLQEVVDRAVRRPQVFASHRIMWNAFSCATMRIVG